MYQTIPETIPSVHAGPTHVLLWVDLQAAAQEAARVSDQRAAELSAQVADLQQQIQKVRDELDTCCDQ
jgi:hypothetical protein